jgi:hypothetical protein
MPIYGVMPDDVIWAMYVCALRFDGYKYEKELGLCGKDTTGDGLSALTGKMLETMVFSRDDNEILAAFFLLQRFFKWSECDTSKDFKESVLFDLLFLHLYKTDVPERYREQHWYAKWQDEHAGRAEELAGRVRDSFRHRLLRGGKLPSISKGEPLLVFVPIPDMGNDATKWGVPLSHLRSFKKDEAAEGEKA